MRIKAADEKNCYVNHEASRITNPGSSLNYDNRVLRVQCPHLLHEWDSEIYEYIYNCDLWGICCDERRHDRCKVTSPDGIWVELHKEQGE